ncbi:signal peptide containing protein [Theileria equi strain WA]|uniref:Signal peptide containing protein n=1 Tax=Theileria equi strain WA TaxID=1537102 RepID=L1LEA6_THEEQ|nr:signal peptide containing protein [Theileria equi strain WA]EKX73585.1 signal peptide containing protein [Theileria equi strain WA]|eukprot:XP_004833037.1 signal peptide containing protein [Theileria equi strain WA]
MNLRNITIATLASLCLVSGYKAPTKRLTTTLLSRLMPNWTPRHQANFALYVPTCSVVKSYPYSTSPTIRVYGITKNYSAVLTGYPVNSSMDPGKQVPCGKNKRNCGGLQNRGVLYGWTDKVRPALTGRSSFVFYTDYTLQKPKEGSSAEYCVHIYSPPVGKIEAINRAIGAGARDPSRNFGSDERLERIILGASKGKTKKIAACCFLLHG